MTPTANRATLIGLLIGTGLATLAALGPLVSAITITVGVETQVGDAAGLPDARMLPAALEGVGAVALIFLLTRRPTGALRAWCAALILVSLANYSCRIPSPSAGSRSSAASASSGDHQPRSEAELWLARGQQSASDRGLSGARLLPNRPLPGIVRPEGGYADQRRDGDRRRAGPRSPALIAGGGGGRRP